MKQLSSLTKIMFCIVAVLLVITVVLGIATAVKDSKENKNNNQSNSTTVTPVATPSVAPSGTENEGQNGTTPDAGATATPVPTEAPVVAAYKIALDPGQQKSAMAEKEPIGPGASSTADKMSYGATSVTTSKREYEWTLPFTLKLKEELQLRGYEVVLTRETDDVKLSNADRAKFANESGADIYISLQADAAASASAKGIYAQIPSQNNAFVGNMYAECKVLATSIQSALIKETGANDRGLQENDKVAAINWSEIPVTVLQLGFMSNKEEDANLWSEAYQDKMVKAICDGIDTYFESLE